MTLRKITIDNSVIFFSRCSNSQDTKPKTASVLEKQNKKFSQNIKNFLKKITAEGFTTLNE